MQRRLRVELVSIQLSHKTTQLIGVMYLLLVLILFINITKFKTLNSCKDSSGFRRRESPVYLEVVHVFTSQLSFGILSWSRLSCFLWRSLPVIMPIRFINIIYVIFFFFQFVITGNLSLNEFFLFFEGRLNEFKH